LRKRKMKIVKSKKTAIAIALMLILSIAIPLVDLHAANAQSSSQLTSYVYIDVAPNPIGSGQTTSITLWSGTPLPTATLQNDVRRHNYTLTITKPDGSIINQNWPVVVDSTGIQFYQYTPDQVGNYTIKFDYGGQIYTWNDTAAQRVWTGYQIQPSTTTITLTVQQDPLPAPIGSYPFPTEYWTRPIEGQNTFWYTIASHWLGGAQFGTFNQGGNNVWQQDGIAPNSSHIMWTKPIEFGGVVGGNQTGTIPGEDYYSGGSYESRFVNAIIMNGYLYFRMPLSNAGTSGLYVCLDLTTGQTIWQNSNISPTFGQLLAYESPNQHGVIPSGYLWQTSGTTWIAYNGFDGSWLFNITGVPSGTNVYDSSGETLRYVLSYSTASHSGSLALWNSTLAMMLATTGTYANESVRNVGLIIDGSKAYSWNVTIPALNGISTPSIVTVLPGDMILGQCSGFSAGGATTVSNPATPDPYTFWAISDKLQSRGQLRWIRNYTAPQGNVTIKLASADPVNRVWTLNEYDTMQYRGYSLDTGELLWTTAITQIPDMQFFQQRELSAYGNFYVSGYGGEIFCFSGNNGTLLWTYNEPSSGLQTPWGKLPIFIAAIADGKIYAETNEHSPNGIYYKGETVYCIDAFSGKEIWNVTSMAGISGGAGNPIAYVADGYLVYYNYYDNQIYSIGKGPSQLTVTAPDTAAPLGTPLVIRGTVTDIAAGTKQNEQAARFPNGVPAVSDASMGSWMAYVYMQKPKPTNATGVPVSIDVIDSNGNYRNIGTTTSDSSGTFTFAWAPDITGSYTVIASFAGSNSYYGSSAETSFYATAAPAATAAPTPTPASMADLYFLPLSIGMIIVIVIVVALLALVLLMLRKRP
jgi:outer membrane protein assembly factor BamB